mgnify:CR=1 FL=1
MSPNPSSLAPQSYRAHINACKGTAATSASCLELLRPRPPHQWCKHMNAIASCIVARCRGAGSGGQNMQSSRLHLKEAPLLQQRGMWHATCRAANCRGGCVSRVGIRERHRAALLPIEGLQKSKEIGHRDHAPGSRYSCSEVLSQSVSTPDALSTLTRPSVPLLAQTQRAHVLLVAPPTPTLATYPADPPVPAAPRGPSSR